MLEMKAARLPPFQKGIGKRTNPSSSIEQAAVTIGIREKTGHEYCCSCGRKKLSELRFLTRLGFL
jgi:hypothetical protein